MGYGRLGTKIFVVVLSGSPALQSWHCLTEWLLFVPNGISVFVECESVRGFVRLKRDKRLIVRKIQL